MNIQMSWGSAFGKFIQLFYFQQQQLQEIYLVPKKFSFRILIVTSPNFDGLLLIIIL